MNVLWGVVVALSMLAFVAGVLLIADADRSGPSAVAPTLRFPQT